MTTLHERLLAAASGMDRVGNTITARLLREAATALQSSPAQPRHHWQPIDSAPKDGETVYLFYNWVTDEFGLGIRPIGCPDDAAASIFPHIAIYPTHWRPLPAAPSRGSCMTAQREVVADALLPCPFCGSPASLYRATRAIHAHVTCSSEACEACGPALYSPEAAIEMWNKRAAIPTQSAGGEERAHHASVLDTVVLPQYGNDPLKYTWERAALNAAIAALRTPAEGDGGRVVEVQEGDMFDADSWAKSYIRDWCPDHVKDYIDRLTTPPTQQQGGEQEGDVERPMLGWQVVDYVNRWKRNEASADDMLNKIACHLDVCALQPANDYNSGYDAGHTAALRTPAEGDGMAEHCRQAGCQVLTPCGTSSLHPEGDGGRVQTDVVSRAALAYDDAAVREGYVSTAGIGAHYDWMRVALDAAWPGMVADAERYRWLREGDSDDLVLGVVKETGEWYLLRMERMDAAIDKAMEASRG